MRLRPRDPLLLAGRLIITAGLGLAIVIGASCLIGAPFLFIFKATVLPALSAEAGHPLGNDALGGMAAILVLITIMAVAGFLFLLDLRRIIDSVGLGDPFIPENARRLTRMGWLTAALQVLAWPVAALGAWIAGMFARATADFSISPEGILLAIILFILARVFREGARMREDLEGTV